MVADLSGAIVITLWEENISKVSVNKSYCFYEMVVNSFNKKHLNSNNGSSIITCDDLVVPEEVKDIAEQMATNEKSCETIAGRILAVSIKRLYTCVNCKCKMADNGKTVLKCSKCKWAIRKADMASCMTSSVVIEDDQGNNIGRFYCPHNAMQSFFTKLADLQVYSIEKADISELSVEMMEETLLNFQKLKFEIYMTDKVIKGIEHV